MCIGEIYANFVIPFSIGRQISAEAYKAPTEISI